MEKAIVKRGRPPKTDDEQELIRRRIIAATRDVFIQEGYHGLSVELILARCGLSRPTFYKYFRHTDEPIEIVLREVNDQLIDSMTDAVSTTQGFFAKIEVAINVWRQWGNELGPLLKPLFSELHDVHSPASKHRARTINALAERIMEAVEQEGKPRPARMLVDALINGVEFLGYRFQLETPRDEASWRQTRSAMLRMTLGLLGSESEWQHAIPLANLLGIQLNPAETS
ncbi:MAG TPA: TetR/AcrR family transcriptional regulator [Pseudomonadales bacterium]|nr:TetR/AcrR family transcriptional regulator [Pseudomonadales bacterium]